MAKKITELPEITANDITADDVIEVSHKDEEIFISKKMTWANIKTALLTALATIDGYVFYNSSVTLDGQNGITVVHNKGDTNYLVKVMPKDVVFGLVGDISVVKAANACVIYNSGISGIAADIELSNIA
jgi:hypothetical protein